MVLALCASCFTARLWGTSPERTSTNPLRMEADYEGTVPASRSSLGFAFRLLLSPVTLTLDLVTAPFQILSDPQELFR